ncbi:MAG: hypothetical protein IPI81_02405 [Flavobacteriales bacterium]|nr:hypothetical protein [Flavobacteriales bacterium]
MNPILRNILVVILGLVVGSVVNMGIITIGPMIIPPPEGADLTTMEGLTAAMSVMTAKHFIAPFLAHALGTLVGAMIAAGLGVGKKLSLAIIVGVFFLVGGIANILMLPSPMWFNILDLVGAYLPMGWLGWKLTGGK